MADKAKIERLFNDLWHEWEAEGRRIEPTPIEKLLEEAEKELRDMDSFKFPKRLTVEKSADNFVLRFYNSANEEYITYVLDGFGEYTKVWRESYR